MRIGVLTTSYPRAPADFAGRFVAELDGWLAERGCEVEVLAPAPAQSPYAGVRVHALRYARRPRLFAAGGAPEQLLAGDALSRAAAWGQVAPYLYQLARHCHLQAARWEALISHWLLPCGVVAARAGRQRPHLAIAHATDVHLIERLPAPLARAALALLSRPRTRLVLTREGLREPLLRCAPPMARELVERALVQRMGVHTGERAVRRRVARQRPQVLFLGRLVELKGVHLLLRAVAGRDVELVIAGDGPERARLEALARRLGVAARFCGAVGDEHKRELLVRADLFVLPSIVLDDGRSDGAPVALLEAMAAGACVVASRVGDVEQLAQHEESALLTPPGDVERLRGAIDRALDDAPLRARLGERARQVARVYDWKEVGARLLAALEAL